MTKFLETNWTIPNLLTVFRIMITPVFVVAFVNDKIMAAWWLFCLAGVTDGLDGFLARVLKQRSKLGAMIDPLADKVLLVTAYVMLGINGWLPSWLVVLVVSRDVIIVGGLGVLNFWSVSIKDKINPIWVSKANTAAQILLIFVVMVSRANEWQVPLLEALLVGAVAVLTVVSGIYYVHTGFSFFPSNNDE